MSKSILTDVRGSRGENIFYIRITASISGRPIFHPTHLGEKWPATDFYIELLDVPGQRLGFFVQVKTTADPFDDKSGALRVRLQTNDVGRLLEIPGPTYFVGVHETSMRAFIYSVHDGVHSEINKIPIRFELGPQNLQLLHEEVRQFWISHPKKPSQSKFYAKSV